MIPFFQSNKKKHIIPFHMVIKAGIYKLSQDRQMSSFSGVKRVTLWSEWLGLGSPTASLWPNMYTLPIWSFGRYAVEVSALGPPFQYLCTSTSLKYRSLSVTCHSCDQKKHLFHAYIQCNRPTLNFPSLHTFFINSLFNRHSSYVYIWCAF